MKFQLGPYIVDTKSHVVWHDATILNLPPKAIELLIFLVEQDGAVVSKAEVRERVWPDTVVEENSVNQLLFVIRKALKPGVGDAEVIETIARRGYRLAIPAVLIELSLTPDGATVGGATSDGAHIVEAKAPRRVPGLAWTFGVVVAASGVFIGARTLIPPPAPVQISPLTDVTFDERMASISPDGKRVAYSRKLAGEEVYDLYVKEVGGPAPVKLTRSEGDAMRAAWSPDGELIAYSRQFPDHGEIRVVSPLGRGDGLLVRLNTSQMPTKGWAPDSKALAYSDNVRPGGGIFLFSMESTQQRRLTTPPPSAKDQHPQFSPDGKLLAFARVSAAPGRQDREDIYVTPVGGGPARRVAEGGPVLHGMVFTHGGEELVFASAMEGSGFLYRISVSGDGPPIRLAGSHDGKEPSLATG